MATVFETIFQNYLTLFVFGCWTRVDQIWRIFSPDRQTDNLLPSEPANKISAFNSSNSFPLVSFFNRQNSNSTESKT
jgi:hypothetical protein